MDIDVVALAGFPVAREKFEASEGNAGIDLYATQDVKLFPGQHALIGTGITLALPEGVEAQVRPRSGLALHKQLSVLNAPGTIDPNYRGEVGVIAMNMAPVIEPGHYAALLECVRDQHSDGVETLLDEYLTSLQSRTITIRRGDRFAQLVFAQFVTPSFRWCSTVGETARGTKAFGSSGTKP